MNHAPPILACVLLLYAVPAYSHESWINKNRLTDPVSGEWCCSFHDCRREQVSEVVGGYRVENGETVPYGRVIWESQDGSWWRCRFLGGEKIGKTRCLIGPLPNT